MRALLRVLVVMVVGCGWAVAAGVRAPTELKVTVLGANSFLLKWKDNSKDETGFQVLASVGAGSEPVHYLDLSGADRSLFLMVANDIPGKLLRVQVKAYRGDGEERVYSKPTSVVEVTAMDRAVFSTPENLRATMVDDGRIRLRWDDVSTTESGYFIEMRKGNGEWKGLGSTSVEKTYNVVIAQLLPEVAYAFRVRGFKGTGGVVTGYSNEAKAKTAAFRSPEGLVAKNKGEGLIALTWKDASSLESGFEIQAREAGGEYESLGTVAANVTSTNPIQRQVATLYDFRVRAFRMVGKKKEYSGFSNVVSKKSLGLAMPSGLKVVSTTESSVALSWTDVSVRETGYALRYVEEGKTKARVVKLAAGATSHTVSGLAAAKTYQFQVRAFDEDTASRYTSMVQASTRDQLVGVYDVSFAQGESFAFDVEATTPENVKSVVVSGLPAGLVFDPVARSVSGQVAVAGLYKALVKVSFHAGYAVTKYLVLRVQAQEGGPNAVNEFVDVQVGVGAVKDVMLGGKFSDSDVTVARRFTTNIGAFDVVLFEATTPGTVRNFLAYADGGRYQNTFFHRAPSGFVVQGGGFTYNGSSMGKVSTFAPVPNEPGISNLRGTVAMAKLGGDPDSATSQFFINLSDANAPNLDFQNGGFTVFGRIAGSGMDLFDEIDAMPKGSYTIAPGGVVTPLEDVPVRVAGAAPATLDPNDLVRVTNVTVAPVLSYAATSLSPAVATVSIAGGAVRVTGVQSGTARIRVRATDLDGFFADQVFDVTVP